MAKNKKNKGYPEKKRSVLTKKGVEQKAPKHRESANKGKGEFSSTLRSAPYSNYSPLEQKIAEMMTENTGIHLLDSGGDKGRSWQQNQGKDFKKEQPTTYSIYKDGSDLVVSFNIFYYLSAYTKLTPEAQKLQKQFIKFAESEHAEDMTWLQSMEDFAAKVNDGSVGENYLSGTTNTYNYDNILSQILQYTGFSYNDKTYLLLQVHGGADARGGYTKPQVFEVPEPEYFIMAQQDIQAYDDNGHKWSSDDGGSHWYADDKESGNLELEAKDGKAYHKGCGAQGHGSEVYFHAMENY